MKTRCDNCSHLGIDGGPGPAMCCTHKGAGEMGYIVHWDHDRRYRESEFCPLVTAEANTIIDERLADLEILVRLLFEALLHAESRLNDIPHNYDDTNFKQIREAREAAKEMGV